MKNKKIGIILILIFFIIILGIFVKNILGNGKSSEIPLDENNFLGAVEVKASPNFILLINKKEKVSNIIFLNEESVDLFSNQRIEGKSIADATEKIVDIMKNENSFEKDSEFILIDYENSEVFSTVKEEFNKQLVVYGVDNNITTTASNFQMRLNELNIAEQSNEKSNLEQLYDYSKKLLQK